MSLGEAVATYKNQGYKLETKIDKEIIKDSENIVKMQEKTKDRGISR